VTKNWHVSERCNRGVSTSQSSARSLRPTKKNETELKKSQVTAAQR